MSDWESIPRRIQMALWSSGVNDGLVGLLLAIVMLIAYRVENPWDVWRTITQVILGLAALMLVVSMTLGVRLERKRRQRQQSLKQHAPQEIQRVYAELYNIGTSDPKQLRRLGIAIVEIAEALESK